MMKISHDKISGFTLIELMVVTFIGVIVFMGFMGVLVRNFSMKARMVAHANMQAELQIARDAMVNKGRFLNNETGAILVTNYNGSVVLRLTKGGQTFSFMRNQAGSLIYDPDEGVAGNEMVLVEQLSKFSLEQRSTPFRHVYVEVGVTNPVYKLEAIREFSVIGFQ